MISLIAHLILILLIAKLIVPSVNDRSSTNLSATSEVLEVIEDVTPDVEFEDMMEDVTGADGESDSSLDAVSYTHLTLPTKA